MGLGYINRSGNYRLEEFGIVHVNVKINARNVTARWRAGALRVSAPTGIAVEELLNILRRLAPRIEQNKPAAPYYLGQTLDFNELEVVINAQNHHPDKIFANLNGKYGHIEVGSEWDMESHDTIKTISRFICRMAQTLAEGVLLPRARQLAQEVGRSPLVWTISNGHRILGHCDSKGVIALSYVLIFYPQQLRDYIIYHELAHLTELNHSPRFHEVCNQYCKGKERELIAQLKAFRSPVPI